MSKLYERISSLTPLLQGKQVNYLPMMVGALKHQDVDDAEVKNLFEQLLKKLPVGDLGEKLYPKSMFDEYYIHKTNFYLGQLKQKSFEELLNTILKREHDLGATYEYAGLMRIYYALKAEDELMLAEALAFFDLSTMQKSVGEQEDVSLDEIKTRLQTTYEASPSRKQLTKYMSLLVLIKLKSYIHHFDDVLCRFVFFLKDVPEEDTKTYLSLEEIKAKEIISFDDPLLMMMKDLLET